MTLVEMAFQGLVAVVSPKSAMWLWSPAECVPGKRHREITE
jgi:hypothetical protein